MTLPNWTGLSKLVCVGSAPQIRLTPGRCFDPFKKVPHAPTTDRQKDTCGRGYTYYYIAAYNTRFQHKCSRGLCLRPPDITLRQSEGGAGSME